MRPQILTAPLSLRPEALPVVLLAVLLSACDTVPAELAPYTSDRPLEILAVTQHYRPQVQWVGGRIGVIGVNRGGNPGLDSTLVWVRAQSEGLANYATVGEQGSAALIARLGGTMADSLESDETYTFWVAEAGGVDLDLLEIDTTSTALADTTVRVSYLLRGRSGGDRSLDVSFRVVREQTLLGDGYVVSWTPASQQFRRMAIRESTLGGFDRLIWHIVVPEGSAEGISMPVTIGVTPPSATEAVPYPPEGLVSGSYTLWANTADWTPGDFGRSSTGYAYFSIFSSNFAREGEAE